MEWVAVMRLVCKVFLALAVFRMVHRALRANLNERTRRVLERRMRDTKVKFLQYERVDLFLSRYGMHYMFPSVEPLGYLCAKSALGVVGFLLAWRLWTPWFAWPFLFVGFFLPEALLAASNKMDNESMLEDIKKVYDTMRIQSRAGVFLNDSLAESYLIIKNRRLKAAVLELVNQIAARNDIERAIDTFNVRFRCSYIDTLCIVIKQSLQSGKTVQLLTDISSQLTYIRHAISLKEKERIERKIALLELMIYIAILGIGIYVLSFEFNNILEL